ncbi:DUF2939 domain-containing protein [Herbaspirillum sp. SJZ107]|uniref:DUF2939 domain-containing protein n=1 Tax=Herbaspirillum sp. SJZ107 TaxID=2572881 RepID=UPI001172C27D|nr:DUF2939 domain-containing protein [Herbaspirillum sp. SJZ107]TQK11530.1 DUF2939 family protein [Herbaspirillum sp. SJZ107]
MPRKLIGWIAILFVILLPVSAWVSPYWDLYRLRTAVTERDAATVSAHVDFAALRDNLKGQVTTRMQRTVGPEDANPFARLGAAMAALAVNPIIDAMVSPAGVMAMLDTGRVGLAKPEPSAQGNNDADAAARERRDWSLHYREWGEVVVGTDAPGAGRFVFRRAGLWHWDLVAIELPQ